MQFHHKRTIPIGTVRTVTKFLWFPKTLGYTTKWLETATWKERREDEYDGFDYWAGIKWVEEPNE